MGAAAVPIMVFSTVASGAMAYSEKKNAAILAKNDGKKAAQMEKIAANEKAIARREKMIVALSSQMAMNGASGVQMSGSALNVAETDLNEFEKEDRRSGIMSRIRQGNYIASGNNQAKALNASASVGLINTAASVAQIGATDWKAN